jgi:hypothetical protein
MTVEEKRAELKNYCHGRSCDKCLIYERCNQLGGCYSPSISDGDVNKNFDIVFGSDKEYIEDKVEPAIDPVNRPAHYNDGKIEVIDYIEDKKLGFCLGNAIKYISRAGKKDPGKEVEDLNKAIWYLERRIKELEEVKA